MTPATQHGLRSEVMPPTIIHLVPYDGIGGVEAAARSIGEDAPAANTHRLRVHYVYEQAPRGLKNFSVAPILRSVSRCLDPEVRVVLVSLWRSALPALVAKVIRPQLKIVAMLHSQRDAHILDFVLTRAVMLVATEIWTDSAATKRARTALFASKRSRVLSFLTQRVKAADPKSQVTANFIFWGRIHRDKGIPRALRLFATIQRHIPSARFTILGPDGGELALCQETCRALGIEESVKFGGPATREEIERNAAQASFYLQASIVEGMAMAVAEAMQLGLVPVVTPVGEIAEYCIDGNNAIIIDSSGRAANEVLRLISSESAYLEVRTRAINHWRGKPLYKESIAEACRDILSAQ